MTLPFRSGILMNLPLPTIRAELRMLAGEAKRR